LDSRTIPVPRLPASKSNGSQGLNCNSPLTNPLTHQPAHSTSPNSTELKNLKLSYVTTDGPSACLSWCQAPIWGLRPDFYYRQTVAGLLMWGALCDERTGLSFTIVAGPRQRSHSWVRDPRDSWPYFTVSDSRLPQPGGPGPRIYIPQEQGGPVIAPGTGFPFRHLLRLSGPRWWYPNPLPRGVTHTVN
jgi:hypothetical protein